MPTKILPCTCKNEYQDKHYGKNMRVMNKCVTPKDYDLEWRCTVCESIKKTPNTKE